MEIHTINQALNTYINCLTFPLGIKMLTDEKELPEKVKIPSPTALTRRQNHKSMIHYL